MSEVLATYDRDNNITGTIEANTFVPEYGSTVSFKNENVHMATSDNFYKKFLRSYSVDKAKVFKKLKRYGNKFKFKIFKQNRRAGEVFFKFFRRGFDDSGVF